MRFARTRPGGGARHPANVWLLDDTRADHRPRANGGIGGKLSADARQGARLYPEFRAIEALGPVQFLSACLAMMSGGDVCM